MAVELSFLTPVYNAAATLPATIAALRALEGDRRCEFILIDDGSQDASPEIIAEAVALDPARFRSQRQDNGGEASALNRAWALAQGRYVAIIEADVAPAPDWLEVCFPILEDHPEAIAVGGWLETPAQDPWIARLAGYEVEAKLATKARSSAHLTSANVLYRHEAFAIAGPFDESLVNASLDSVFNAALARAGHALIFEPKARARHHYKPRLSGYLRRQYAYARYRVYNENLELYPADRALAILGFLDVLSVLTSGLAFGLAALAPRWRSLALPIAVAALLLPLLLHLPAAVAFLKAKRDLAALAFPPVAALRSLVAALGYGLGWMEKRWRKKDRHRSQKKPKPRREG